LGVNRNLVTLVIRGCQGEYKQELHQFDHDIKDGFTNVIGSGNQVVYDCKKEIGMPAGILSGISLDEKDNLIFHMKK